jgi:hypothetical protein
MTTTVKIDIDNPTQLESVLAFIEKLGLKAKVLKNGKTANPEMDEDEYLFSSKKNKERLIKALDNIEKGENLVEIDLVEFEKQYTN